MKVRSSHTNKTIFLLLSISIAITSFAQPTPAYRPKTNEEIKKDLLNKRPGIKTVGPSNADLEAARNWINIFGYNLTVDQVRTMKEFRAVGGTIERAQALTTANMKNLRVLTNLETLELAQFGNDDWVAEAAGLTKLRVFIMGPARNLTDRSAAVFAGWPELRILSINASAITDAGIQKLAGLKNLENLSMQYMKITNASMPAIGNMSTLLHLTLSFTNITDAGLPYLYNLKNLKSLYIQGQNTSDAAINLLRQNLPGCNVVH